MEKKIIALDLDGTLLTSKKTILPKTKEALIDAQKRGMKVVLSSGRPFPGMDFIASELELDKYEGYILAFNGGEIVDYKTKEKVFSKSIEPKDFQEIYDLSIIHDTNILTYKDGKVYAEFFDEWVEVETRINKMEYVETDDLLSEITGPVPKFIMLGHGEYLEKIEPLICEQLEGRFSVTRSEPFFLEIMPLGVDKGASLKRLADHLGLGAQNVVACGDSYNDMTMVSYAGLGVAMGNAKEPVKEIANYITATNEDDGIVEVLDKFCK